MRLRLDFRQWPNVVAQQMIHALSAIRVAGQRRAATHVLILRSSSLGDFANVLPFLASLRHDYRRADTDLLILSRVGPIAEQFLPPGDDVSVVTIRIGRLSPFLRDVRRARSVLRGRAYREVIFAGQSGEGITGRMKKLVLLRAIVGFGPPLRGFAPHASFAGRAAHVRDPERTPLHQSIIPFCATGRPIDISRQDTLAVLDFQRDEISRVDELLANRVAAGRWVGLSVSAKDQRKRWDLEGFVTVCNHLLASNSTCLLLVGGPADRERAAELAARLERDRVRVLCGQTTVRESVLLLGRLRLLIANDSAPVHLAGLAGTPVVSIFCNWEAAGFWEPILAPRSRSVRPDWTHRRPEIDDYGIRTIPAELVIRASEELLRGDEGHSILTAAVERGAAPRIASIRGFPFLDRPVTAQQESRQQACTSVP